MITCTYTLFLATSGNYMIQFIVELAVIQAMITGLYTDTSEQKYCYYNLLKYLSVYEMKSLMPHHG